MVEAREEEEFALVARRGRPRIQIQEDRLCFLIESGFKVNDVAAICACSRRTIERRLQELQMRPRDYTRLSDGELDAEVEHIVSLHPQCGEKTILDNCEVEVSGYKGNEYGTHCIVLTLLEFS